MTAAPALDAFEPLFDAPPGARCDLCPLAGHSGGGPILGAGPEHARLVILGEAPGHREVKEGRPFVGRSGRLLAETLARLGVKPSDARRTNVLLCQPPDDLSLEDYLASLPKGTPDPRECCRGRLLDELQGVECVFALGGTALGALAGVKGGIHKWRGSPLRVSIPDPPDFDDTRGLAALPRPGAPADRPEPTRTPDEAWVIPIFHPAFVLRPDGARFTTTFKSDVAKGVRIWRTDKTRWDESDLVPEAPPEALVAACAAARESGKAVAVDIETAGGHPLLTNLLCVGFAWGESARVIPFRRVDSEPWPYEPGELEMVTEALRALLADETVAKTFHNHLYDVPILERHGFPVRGPLHDTMLMHHARWSELPHSLAFVGSVYTDARYWKDDVRDGGKFDPTVADEETFHRYNARDALVTLRVARRLWHEMPEQKAVYAQEMALAPIARAMHENGMLLDPVALGEARARLRTREEAAAARLRELLVGTDYAERAEQPQDLSELHRSVARRIPSRSAKNSSSSRSRCSTNCGPNSRWMASSCAAIWSPYWRA